MGYLMRRNILSYKAPPYNEGYDLICIHPDPRRKPKKGKLPQARVQVKSRYATDCDRGFPVKEESLDAFDFLVIAFLNIGKFYGRNDGLTGARDVDLYTLTPRLVRKYRSKTSTWGKVHLRGHEEELAPLKNEAGFEQIAEVLGIPRPRRKR